MGLVPVSCFFVLGVVTMHFLQVESESDIENARLLFEEYAAGLGIDMCFQNFTQELAELPGKYAPPSGRLLLAFADEKLAGCIALRKIDAETCEMKRLFLRSGFRDRGFGKVLLTRIIDEARSIGYKRMLLDTLPGKMDAAIRLYERFGFQDIPAYYDNPLEGVRYMELRL
jgi:GNAT superfamily N-acetyltransferase